MKILETRGIHTELARDGEEAVNMFKKSGPYHYQAVLMDVMMPIMDGLEAARQNTLHDLRREHRLRTTLILSAFLIKPIHLNEL